MTRSQRIALILTALAAALALVAAPLLWSNLGDVGDRVTRIEQRPCRKLCQRQIAARVLEILEAHAQGGGAQTGSTPGQQPGPPSGGSNGGDGGQGPQGPSGPPGPPGPPGTSPPPEPGPLDPVTEPVCDLTGVCL